MHTPPAAVTSAPAPVRCCRRLDRPPPAA